MKDTTALVDVDEWAALVKELLGELTPETAAQPTGPLPASSRTIRRWRDGEMGVKPEKIVEICRAVDYPVVRALVRVKFIEPEEAGVVGLAPTQTAIDPLARRVDTLLSNKRIPATARTFLRSTLDAALTYWLTTFRGSAPPKEPTAAERAVGKPVTDPTPRKVR